jgi:hypothetical protein
MITFPNVGRQKLRRWAVPAVVALAAVTLYLNWITIWTVWSSKSEVPWRDQWVYLDDVKSILAGSIFSTSLWYPYWGHRLVITRLITLLDVRFFSGFNTPILAFGLIVQTAHAALLSFVAWWLFRGLPWWIFVLTAALIFHLSLSSLQMENLIFAGQIGYIVVGAAASAAFLLLSLYSTEHACGCGGVLRRCFLIAACILSALISTLSRPDGGFVLPVLFVQASLLRVNLKVRILFALTGCFVLSLYFWRYDAGPSLGMGVWGALTHPQQSLPLFAMLLLGPLSVLSRPIGTWLGCTSLVFVVYWLYKISRTRPELPPMLTVYTSVALYSLISIWGLVTSRVSPEFVASREHFLLLPSRYFTLPFLFWASMWVLSVWLINEDRRTWPQFLVLGAVTLLLTFGTAFWQVGEAKNWHAYYKELDVAATALILDVHDGDNAVLERIYPDGTLRQQIRDWLQRDELSVFHEQRAHLMGLQISQPPIQVEEGRCQGAWESSVAAAGNAHRVSGWVWDVRKKKPPSDLVFIDASGKAVGIARSGLRRPDLKGKVAAAYLDDNGWQGYVTVPNTGAVEVYGVLPEKGHYCHVAGIGLR